MELKARAQKDFEAFSHICPEYEANEVCFHLIDIISTFRTKRANWELAYMHRQEFDKYFHEECPDYLEFGTCEHIDEINLTEFQHKDCEQYANNQSCSHLSEILGRCVSKYTGEELIIRSEFIHHECTHYKIFSRCYHIEDLIARKVFYVDYLKDLQLSQTDFMEPSLWEMDASLKKLKDEANDYSTVPTTF